MQKDAYHRIVLTHRTDLKDYVEHDPEDDSTTVIHPRQAVSGILREIDSNLFIDTPGPDGGNVLVDVSQEIDRDISYDTYKNNEDGLNQHLNKPVDMALDETGRHLTIRVHDNQSGTTVFRSQFYDPPIPLELMPRVDISDKEATPVKGHLVCVHSPYCVELTDEKDNHVLVWGNKMYAIQIANADKLVGQLVQVSSRNKTYWSEGMGITSLENEKTVDVEHVITLTHRKDLSDRTRWSEDKAKAEITHPRQSVSGTLLKTPGHHGREYSSVDDWGGPLLMNTDEFGVAYVETNGKLSNLQRTTGNPDTDPILELLTAEDRGRRVCLTYNDAGNTLSVQVMGRGDESAVAQFSKKLDIHPDRPRRLVTLVEKARMNGRPATGTLVAVHDLGYPSSGGHQVAVEMADSKGNHVMFSDVYDKAHSKKQLAEALSLVGKEVRVVPGETLQVVSVSKRMSKSKGLER
jgi:hypothetical protein